MSEKSSDVYSETDDSSTDSGESTIKSRLKKKLKQLRRSLNKNNANNEWLLESIRNLNPVQSENVPIAARQSYQDPPEIEEESIPKKSYSTSTDKEAFDKQQRTKHGTVIRKQLYGSKPDRSKDGGYKPMPSAGDRQRKSVSQPISISTAKNPSISKPQEQPTPPHKPTPTQPSGIPKPKGPKPKQAADQQADMYVSPRLKNIRLQEQCTKLEQTVKEKDSKIDDLMKQIHKVERTFEGYQEKMSSTQKVTPLTINRTIL